MNKDEKVWSESEILDLLRGLDVIYQSKSFIGKLLWWPWHACLESIAIILTSGELDRRSVISEVENIMLRKESGDEDGL